MDLSPDAWATVGVGITAIASLVAAVTVAHIKTSRSVENVRRLAEPTGNGFASHTLNMLSGLTEQVTEMHRDMVELRSAQDRERQALFRHLEDHATNPRRWRR
jgi:hypothetical protein